MDIYTIQIYIHPQSTPLIGVWIVDIHTIQIYIYIHNVSVYVGRKSLLRHVLKTFRADVKQMFHELEKTTMETSVPKVSSHI